MVQMENILFFQLLFLVFSIADGNSLQPLHFPSTTIPAFPEQSDVATNCPLTLPPSFFTVVSQYCSSPISRLHCCPTLSAWLYSSYSAAFSLSSLLSSATDLPVLPDDTETCVSEVEKAMRARGVVLGKVNASCGVIGCYCGVSMRPLSCSSGIKLEKKEGAGWVAMDEKTRRVERDCMLDGVHGCSRCLRSLYMVVNRRNTTSASASASASAMRKKKKQHRDCQLMAITWLLAKNRTLYLPTLTKILRVFMMESDGQDPRSCTLAQDGEPLAVDSIQFSDVVTLTSSSSYYASCNHIRWILACLSLSFAPVRSVRCHVIVVLSFLPFFLSTYFVAV